eukprot:1327270-Amorphochlora_amoeboformis.AAC.2
MIPRRYRYRDDSNAVPMSPTFENKPSGKERGKGGARGTTTEGEERLGDIKEQMGSKSIQDQLNTTYAPARLSSDAKGGKGKGRGKGGQGREKKAGSETGGYP